MYLETHRGTKSSQMEIKHLNRRTELWIACAERLHTIMNVLHPGLFSFDKKEQFEEWRSLMFNQFHDILPGSSIPDVYELAFKELRNTIANAQSRIAMMLNAISHDPSEILIYNPYNWSYTGYIPYNDKMLYVDQVPGLSIQKMQIKCDRRTGKSRSDYHRNAHLDYFGKWVFESPNLQRKWISFFTVLKNSPKRIIGYRIECGVKGSWITGVS